jgi:putative transposase
MAVNLRQPTEGLLFHSDRSSQYTSKRYQALLKQNKVITFMSGRGACLDNAVVERFFGSLKNEWLLHVSHQSRNSMKIDVEKYIKYYIYERLHTTLNDMSPIKFESVKEMCAA